MLDCVWCGDRAFSTCLTASVRCYSMAMALQRILTAVPIDFYTTHTL
jgi:hypothetical protein